MSDPTPTSTSQALWQHPWLRIERLIRSLGYTRWDKATRPIAKEVLKRAVAERKKIRRAGWMN